jgi:hypothetical protein
VAEKKGFLVFDQLSLMELAALKGLFGWDRYHKSHAKTLENIIDNLISLGNQIEQPKKTTQNGIVFTFMV